MPFSHSARRSTVSSFIHSGKWQIPSWFRHQFPLQSLSISNITLPISPSQPDVLMWPASHNGDITFSDAYKFYSPHYAEEWTDLLWHSHFPPRISSTVWKITHNRISTQDNLQKRGKITASRCDMCLSSSETVNHLFLRCNFAARLWKWIWDTFNIPSTTPHSISDLWNMIRKLKFSPQIRQLLISCCLICLYALWDTRNKLIFHNIRPVPSRTLHYIKGWVQAITPLSPGHMANTVVDLNILKKLQH